MEFNKVTCFGTGLIGGSWSTLFALKGLDVTLYDTMEDSIKGAMKKIESNLNVLSQEGLIDEADKRNARQNIRIVDNLENAVKEAEYIQESVFEDYNLKRNVYNKLDRLTSSKVILASSSSGLLMSEIQQFASQPKRCIIAHPWNPPHIIPLVEIVPGNKTSQETVDQTRRFMSDLGKVPVVLKKEVPGFIGNRLSAALWREAINLLDEGVASAEDIDKAVHAGPGLRWSIMGPFMTYHLGGGEGGIKRFIDGIGRSFTEYWKTMNPWTSIPEDAVQKMVQEMDKVSLDKLTEISKKRDKKLLQLLTILHPKTYERIKK